MSEHLIILPCHGIWKRGPSNGESSDEWYLASFQIQGKDHLCFKEHIQICLDLLKKDPQATLVISGGQTKKEAGPISEALSYYELALRLKPSQYVLERVTTEEFARDSFENVLYLICRFYELHERYPSRITIVGFEFKRDRFINKHLKQALLYQENIEYIGNMPNPVDLNDSERRHYFEDIEKSEHDHAVIHFARDWYGVMPPLSVKKERRNPFNRYHGYALSNPKLSKFFSALSTPKDDETNLKVREKLSQLPWVTQ